MDSRGAKTRRQGRKAWGCVLVMLTALAGHDGRAEEFRLSLPLDCIPGVSCFIQNYVDVAPGPQVLDYRCGGQSYDGHKGTDFRLLSTRQAQEMKVAVRAAASGVVKALRDGMADRLVTKTGNVPTGRECGNGVVIDHGEGRETQYCHLLNGSVAVRVGQSISRGERLGSVGYSGWAQFAHLHFALRIAGRVIDPFSGRSPDGRCDAPAASSYWRDVVAARLGYRDGELLQAGFASGALKAMDLETGSTAMRPPAHGAAAIVLYARFINLRKGDRISLSLSGAEGPVAKALSPPLESNKAHYVYYAGKKRGGRGWPAGLYHGEVRLVRADRVVLSRQLVHRIR
ncbi:MAG: M23 family metallopeptidase [Methyloligellaceae bacterium]